MKTLSTLATFVATCFCILTMQLTLAEERVIERASTKAIPSERKTSIGSSQSNPIVIKGIKTYDKVREKQDEYIRKQYGSCEIVLDMFFLNDDQHFIQGFMLENDEGKPVRIYFDINDICKASRKLKDKKLERRIQKAKEAAKYKTNV